MSVPAVYTQSDQLITQIQGLRINEHSVDRECEEAYDGYDTDDGYGYGGSSVSLNPVITSGDQDGPEGYLYQGPYPDLDQHIAPGDERMTLINSFMHSQPGFRTLSWSFNILQALGTSVGRFSVRPLGSGFNSSAFVMQQEESATQHVLRAFSVYHLRQPHLQKAFQLNRHQVGGEWLSATLNHPNLANNTHIVAWDSLDNSFKVMNQNEVQELIENRHLLQEGRQIYAVATIGDYVEGSQDLEKVFRSNLGRSEEELKPLLRDIFEGVAAMNRDQIVHRDLKAANVILLPTDQAKIIDFGSAAIQTPGENLPVFGDRAVHPVESHFNVGGVPKHTNEKTDSYSLFLLTYRAVTGGSFFGNKTKASEIKVEQKAWFEKQRSQNFRQLLDEDPKLASVSAELKDLMANLGTANEAERYTAEEALTHSFFANREVSHSNAA